MFGAYPSEGRDILVREIRPPTELSPLATLGQIVLGLWETNEGDVLAFRGHRGGLTEAIATLFDNVLGHCRTNARSNTETIRQHKNFQPPTQTFALHTNTSDAMQKYQENQF